MRGGRNGLPNALRLSECVRTRRHHESEMLGSSGDLAACASGDGSQKEEAARARDAGENGSGSLRRKGKRIYRSGQHFWLSGNSGRAFDGEALSQYLLRTDEMEYHIRPTDGKHPAILPVGKEGEFKIKKDHMFLKVPDGDKKTRNYQVVAITPLNKGTTVGGQEDVKDKHLTGNLADKNTASRTAEKYPDSDPPRH